MEDKGTKINKLMVKNEIKNASSKENRCDPNVDGGFAWIVLTAVVLVDSLVRPVQKCLGVLFKEIQKELRLTNALVMLISGTMFGVSNLMGPFSSLLCHRFGCRTMILLGTMFIAVGLGTIFFIKNVIAIILIISILPGLGQSFMLFPNIHILSCYFKKRFTTANGFRLSGTSIGSIIFPLILPVMVEEVGLYGSMLIMAGLILNVIPLSIFYRQKRQKAHIIEKTSEKSPEQIKKTITDTDLLAKYSTKQIKNNIDLTKFAYLGFDYSKIESSEHCKEPIYSLHTSVSKANLLEEGQDFICCGLYNSKCCNSTTNLSLLKSFPFWVYSISILLNNMQYNSVAVILSPHAQNLGYNIVEGASLITILSSTELISRLSTGYVIDKLHLHRRLCFMVSILLTSVIIYIISFATEYYIIALCCAFFGFLSGITFTLIVPLLSEYFGLQKIAIVVGFTTPITGAGNIILPYIIGVMADIYDGFEEAFLLLGTLSFCTLICEFYLLYAAKKKKNTQNLTF